MKTLRHIGSLAFILGLFTTIFAGLPWHVITTDNPAVPLWLKIAIFSLLGGILLVLVTVAIEQRGAKPAEQGSAVEAADGTVQLLNSDKIPGREIAEIIGLVQGHTVYAIWLGKDLSALIRLVLGGELTEYTEMMGSAAELLVYGTAVKFA